MTGRFVTKGETQAMTTKQDGMTNRERILKIVAGESPDRVPWIPRPDIWYEANRLRGTLPAKYREATLDEVRRDLGMGTWDQAEVYRAELRGVDVITHEEGRDAVTEYVTPAGTVSTRLRTSETLQSAGIVGQKVERLIKGPDDYAAVEYMVAHTDVIPIYDEFMAREAWIGEHGCPLVLAPMDPISQLMLDFVGYNNVYYHLHDYPRQVASLSEALLDLAARMQDVVLDSPADLVFSGSHFGSMMTPPPVFRKMLPYYQAFAERIHARGKWMVCHADADTSLLLDLLVEAGYDMMDSFVTAPMVPVTLEQARAVFGRKVTIWGGLPSTLLCDPTTDAEFEAYMQYLLRTIAPGDAFILGVADNIMPESKLERIERVGELIEEYGRYPVSV